MIPKPGICIISTNLISLQDLITHKWPPTVFQADLSLILIRQDPQLLSASTAATHPRRPRRLQHAAYAKKRYFEDHQLLSTTIVKLLPAFHASECGSVSSCRADHTHTIATTAVHPLTDLSHIFSLAISITTTSKSSAPASVQLSSTRSL